MIAILSNEPVMAAKPVAQTIASSGYSTPFTSMPLGREALDRRLRHVDQFYMRQIVGLEIAGIDAQSRLQPNTLSGHSSSAVAGSLTMPRIFRRANSAMVSLAGLLEQQVAIGAEERQARRAATPPHIAARAPPRVASSAGFMLNGK